jgi:hypothetical protein
MRENTERTLYAARDRRERPRLMLLTKAERSAFGMAAVYQSFEDNELFTDFVEYFPYDGGICGVFVNHLDRRDLALDDFAARSSPETRLIALRSLLATLLAQNAPPAVACDLLEGRNCFASAGGQLHFVYDLGAFSLRGTDASQLVWPRLAATIETIVLNDLRSSAMEAVLEGLRRGHYQSWHEAYQAIADAIGRTDTQVASQSWEAPETLGERIDALTAGATDLMATILARGLFVLAFVVLAYLTWTTVVTPHVDNGISQIGGVEVYHASE